MRRARAAQPGSWSRRSREHQAVLARIRPRPSFIPAPTASTVAFALLLESLIPSSQITAVTPERLNTSRSSRWRADGRPEHGFWAEYFAGPTTWLPPMPGIQDSHAVAISGV